MSDSPELDIADGTYLGKAFGGHAFSVPLDKADAFYQAYKGDMVASGTRSFLSSMRIPGGFFKERNPVLQQELVVDTKATVKQKKKADELYVLVIDGVIQYVAPHLPASLGWEDPMETLGLNPEVWAPIEFDVNCGCVEYIFFPDKGDLVEDQYFPVAFLTLPIFYSKPIKIDLGIYKLRCQNGAMDDINTSSATFKPDSLNPDIFAAFAGGVKTATNHLSEQYRRFLDYLSTEKLGIESARTFMKSLLEDPDPPVPTRLAKKVLQHIDLLGSGKDVPAHSPDTMDNTYDLFDTFTFYSHQGSTKLTSRNNTDRKSLRLFYSRYREEIGEDDEETSVLELPEFLKTTES